MQVGTSHGAAAINQSTMEEPVTQNRVTDPLFRSTEPGQPSILDAFPVVLHSKQIGPDVDALCAKTGVSRALVAKIAIRMRAAHLWNDTTADCTEWYDADGECNLDALVHHVQVAIGQALRIKTDAGYTYVPVEEGGECGTQSEEAR